MIPTRPPSICRLILATTVCLFAGQASAITISFDPGQLYSTTGGDGGAGNLKGQPSGGTQWTGGVSGSDASIIVTANEGAEGNDQAACTQHGSRLSPKSDYVFIPSDDDLGGKFDSSSSVLYYSFQLKPTAAATSFGSTILRMRLCGTDDKKSAINFGLGNNGSFSWTAGDGKGAGTSLLAKTTPGGAIIFVPAIDTYFTVRGAINYGAKTFTISVNGVEQEINGDKDFHFASLTPGTPRIDLENFAADDPLWASTSIDNISLSLSPDGVPTFPQGKRLPRSKPAPGPNLVPAFKVGENLIPNPSFENPEDSYAWRRNNYGKNDVEFALDKDNPHSGSQSQRISLKHVTGSVAVLQFMSPQLGLRPGTSFQLRFWARGPANTRPIAVELRNAGPPYANYFRAEVTLHEQWTESVFEITMPPSTNMHDCVLQFEVLEENTFWLDDVSLALLPPAEEGTQLVGNQVKNGSFEVGKDKWYAMFREQGARNSMLANENNVTANILSVPAKDAPNGQKVLAWEILNGSSFELNSAYFHLRYGHPATISFWMNTPTAHTGITASLGEGKFPNMVNETQTFKSPSAGWNFYNMTVTPKPSDGGTYFLDFKLSGPGKYELDAVSAVEGETADKTYPPIPTEAGWLVPEKTPAGNLFYPDDKISFPLDVATAPGKSAIAVHLREVDYRDRELKHWDTSVSLDAQGRGEEEIALPSDRLGGFKVEARFAENDPAKAADAEILYSVVPKLKPPGEVADSFYGAHVDLTPYNLAIAQRLGIRWVRLNGPLCTRWVIVQEAKGGPFKFSTEGVSRAHEMGFRVQGIFDSPPWFYQEGDPAQTKLTSWYSSYPVGDWDAWREYVKATATAFAPFVQAWEVANEPDGGFLKVHPGEQKEPIYVKMLQQTHQALDDAGIKTYLIGNVCANIDRTFTVNELNLGGGKEVDAVSFHLYNEDRGPEEKLPSLADQLAKIRSYPNRSGNTPEIWNTENGIWLSTSRSWLGSAQIPSTVATTIADAANTVSRNLAGLKAMGVKRYFQYAVNAAPSGGLVYRDECRGIVDTNGIPHAAGAAYAASVYFLEDAQPVGLEVKDAGAAHVTTAKFNGPKGPITVVWSRVPTTLGQVPGVDWQKASGFDLMGNPMDLSVNTNVTLDPIYLVGKQ
jgi:hypothetical protein